MLLFLCRYQTGNSLQLILKLEFS